MDKQKVKEILIKIGNAVEKLTKLFVDCFTLAVVIGLGFIGCFITSEDIILLQAFNAGDITGASPELGMLLIIVAMIGLILISVPFIYLSLYWRITE